MKSIEDFGGYWPEYCEVCGRPLDGYTRKSDFVGPDREFIFLACEGGNPIRKLLNRIPGFRNLWWHYEVLVGSEPRPAKYDAFTGEKLR